MKFIKDKFSIYSTPEILAESFAEHLRIITDEIIYQKGKVDIALSGGNTPKLLYKIMADKFSGKISWNKINFYWTDERCVPSDSNESNFGEADRILFLKLNCNLNLYMIKGESDPVTEAERYSELLKKNLPLRNAFPEFDIILLGMGEDGHTASIFPGQSELLRTEKYCDVSVNPISKQSRITITGRVINNADRVFFLVTGSNKSKVIKEISERGNDSLVYPAAFVSQSNGEINWYLDSQAASLLTLM